MNIIINTPQYIQEVGQRHNQEDTIYPAPGQATNATRLFMVCDGMGGYDSGEVASSIVATTMAHELEGYTSGLLRKEDLLAALEKAYDALNAADTHPEEPVDNKMGTTLALLAFSESGAMAMHIGDSRIYHFRPSTRQLMYRSKDHSRVQQLYDLGEITFQQMATHPQKNILVKAMRPSLDTRKKPDIVQIVDIAVGDYFMLGSDGMFEYIDEQQVMNILANGNLTDREKAERLAELSENSHDNHSAYLIGIDQVKRFDDDARLVDEEARVRTANHQLYTELMRQGKNLQPSSPGMPGSADDSEPITAPAVAADDNEAAVEALEVTAGPSRQHNTHKKKHHTGATSKMHYIIAVLSILLVIAMGIIAILLSNGKTDSDNSRPVAPAITQPQKWSTKPQPTRQQAAPVPASSPSHHKSDKQEAKPSLSNQIETGNASPGDHDGGKKDKVDQILDQLGTSKPQSNSTQTSGASQVHQDKPNVANDLSNALGGGAKPANNAGSNSSHRTNSPLNDTE